MPTWTIALSEFNLTHVLWSRVFQDTSLQWSHASDPSSERSALCCLCSGSPAHRCTAAFIIGKGKDQGRIFGEFRRIQKGSRDGLGLQNACLRDKCIGCKWSSPDSVAAVPFPISPPTSTKSKNKKLIPKRCNEEISQDLWVFFFFFFFFLMKNVAWYSPSVMTLHTSCSVWMSGRIWS